MTGIPVPVLDPPVSIDLFRVRLPLLQPHRAAHGEEHDRDVVLVAWHDLGGVTGWGECPTMRSGYGLSTDDAWWMLTEEVAGVAVEGGLSTLPLLGPTASVAASVMDAACDAAWVAAGVPAAVALGATSLQLPRTKVVAAVGAPLDEVVELVAEAVSDGATQVKLKIQPGWDVEPLTAARAVLGSLPLAADANGSYERADAVPEEIDELGLAYLEDPVIGLEELRALSSAFRTTIAVDEDIIGPERAFAAVEAGAGAISIKPSRVGGLIAAVDLAAELASMGVACFVGGMLETGIGRAGALAVAANPAFLLPTDLGPSAAYFASDLCRPLTVDAAGRLIVPAGRGIGRVPDTAMLARVTVDHRRFD